MQFNTIALKKLLSQKCDEIEIKFKISQELILKILRSQTEKPEITYSVVLLKGSARRESFYDIGTLKKTHHEDILKTVHDSLSNTYAKIVCASETHIKDFDPKQCTDIRLKKRFAVALFAQSAKRDITIIKNISAKTPKLPTVINDFFSTEDFSEMELEVEFLSGFNLLDENQKIQVVNDVQKQLLGSVGIKEKPVNHLVSISNYLHSIGVLKREVETVKQITNNPKLFSKDIFETNYEPSNFMVMEKSDGLRCILKICGGSFIEITENSQISFPTSSSLREEEVIDCEKKNGEYYAFDLIIYSGEYLKKNYLERIALLRQLAEKTKIFKVKEICEINCDNILRLSKNNDVDGLIFQEIKPTYYDARILKWKPLELLTFDFLIVYLPYTGISPFVLSDSSPKIGEKYMHLLFVGCAKKKNSQVKFPGFYQKLLVYHNLTLADYNPVPFTPPIAPYVYIWETDKKYDLCVGEFVYKHNAWQLLKIREDKTALISKRIFGNDYAVAEAQFNELNNPLTLDMLCSLTSLREVKGESLRDSSVMTRFQNNTIDYVQSKGGLPLPLPLFAQSAKRETQSAKRETQSAKREIKRGNNEGKPIYFQAQKDMEYSKMTKFNNYVKFRIMCTIRGFKRVLDIASGRGADIFIYNGLEVGFVSFVEPDKAAFIELSNRLKMLGERKFYTHTDMPKKNIQYDLTNEDYDTFATHCRCKYNALVCNFAAHYFLKTRTDYRAFGKFCVANEIEIVILLILDSEIVDAHMTNGVYKNDKYYISSVPLRGEEREGIYEKGNENDTYWIKHHFAKDLIPESKINTPELIKAMSGYELIKRDSFGAYAAEYEEKKNVKLNLLDLEYSSFYQYLVFRR